MDRRKQEIEREILKGIIQEVHNSSVRISDSLQREIIFLVRKRIPEGATWEKLDRKKIRLLIEKFARNLQEAAPESETKEKRVVIRKSILERIKKLVSDIWPFGE